MTALILPERYFLRERGRFSGIISIDMLPSLKEGQLLIDLVTALKMTN